MLTTERFKEIEAELKVIQPGQREHLEKEDVLLGDLEGRQRQLSEESGQDGKVKGWSGCLPSAMPAPTGQERPRFGRSGLPQDFQKLS